MPQNTPIYKEIVRESSKEGYHWRVRLIKCSRATEKRVQPALLRNRSHISTEFSWGLAIKQIGAWCGESLLLNSLSWKMAAWNDSRENSLSTLNCSSLSLWNHYDFRCTLLWLEPSVIPSLFWSAIDFHCSFFFFLPVHSVAFAAGFNISFVALPYHRKMHWLESRRTLLKPVTKSMVRYRSDSS